MEWNVKDVKRILNEVESMTGEKLGLIVEVNGRLSRALARCLTKVINGKHIPYKLEFGNTILNVSDYEIFRQIVLHEVAHAIANKKYQDNCHHDSRFKKVCHEIGCYNTGAYCSEEYSLALQQAFDKLEQQKTKATGTTKKVQQEQTKYTILCECGQQFHYKKMTEKLRHLGECQCGKCKKVGKLKLIQNW